MQAQARKQIEVRVHVDSLDDRLLISVRDDGVGMPEHTLNHAFDPFFSDRSAGRGAGLGLARARRLVDLHSGELRLESTPGEGTTAHVALPEWRAAKPKSKKAA
jgi:signal transduction histidine kinase